MRPAVARPASTSASAGSKGVRRGDRIEDHPVGQLTRQPQRLRAAGPEQERRRLRRRLVERDTGQVRVAAVDLDATAVQQVAHGGGVLAQQRHRRLHPGSDLSQPVEHAMAQARHEPVREQMRQRGDLHRHQRRVAQRHREQPDTDPQPLLQATRRPRRGRLHEEASHSHSSATPAPRWPRPPPQPLRGRNTTPVVITCTTPPHHTGPKPSHRTIRTVIRTGEQGAR